MSELVLPYKNNQKEINKIIEKIVGLISRD